MQLHPEGKLLMVSDLQLTRIASRGTDPLIRNSAVPSPKMFRSEEAPGLPATKQTIAAPQALQLERPGSCRGTAERPVPITRRRRAPERCLATE
jgi:hypothetical protein